jgi:hypothetical protein
MRRAVWSIAVCAALIVLGAGSMTMAKPALVEDLSQGHSIGFGIDLTAPFAPPNTFPASGLSGRFWIANLFGFEATLFVVDQAPSLSGRAFIKYLNTSVADLYVGTGVAFFGSGGTFVVPLQAVSGIEVRLTPNFAISAEVGLLFRGVSEVTAGLGFHFYL